MTLIYLLLPVLSGVLLVMVVRRERRQQLVQNRLAAIRTGGEAVVEAPISLARLRRVASRGMSFTVLLPHQIRAYLDGEFEAAGNRIGILHLVIAAMVTAVVVNLFTSRILTLGPGLVLLVSLAAACIAPIGFLRSAQTRYKNRFLDVFPDALDLIGRGIKAGLPVNEALVVAGQEIAEPVGTEFKRALEQVQLGVPMIEALEKVADRIRIADFRFLVVTLALQARTGGSLAETLANLGSVIRARKHLRLKVRGLTAEAKVSAMVLAALPFIVGTLMYVINRDLTLPLFVDPRGRFMVGVAFVMLLSGLSLMYLMIKRAVR